MLLHHESSIILELKIKGVKKLWHLAATGIIRSHDCITTLTVFEVLL